MMFDDEMTLAAARDELRGMVADGHRCPCCSQMAKVYPRRIHKTMARELVAMYQFGAAQYPVALNDALANSNLHKRGGDFAKLRYWELVVESDAMRADGGHAGRWRITAKGVEFVNNRISVPQTANVYDGRLMSYGDETKRVTIVDCLGDSFDYRVLMDTAVGDTLPIQFGEWEAAV